MLKMAVVTTMMIIEAGEARPKSPDVLTLAHQVLWTWWSMSF